MIGKLLFVVCLALAQVSAGLEPEYVFSASCPPAIKHYLIPHESDCTKFHYCEFGMQRLHPTNCAPGTEFSYALQVCTFPSIAGCSISTTTTTTTTTTTAPPPTTTTTTPTTTTTTPTTTTTTPTTTTTTPTTTTTTTSTTPPPVTNECPTDHTIHRLLPHETSCILFYYCVFGEKELRVCSDGTHFNRVLQVCDWPSNAGCTTRAETGVGGPGQMML